MPSQSLSRGTPGYNRQRTRQLRGDVAPISSARPPKSATGGNKSLQRQGVPIPDHLGNNRATKQGSNAVASPARSSTRSVGTGQPSQSIGRSKSRNSGGRSYNPAALGTNAGGSIQGRPGGSSNGGVGLLEAEFLLAITLLIMLLFANTSASYTDKIMSLMKRGTLACLLFFLLALISSIGPNAAKICKAIGALVIVAILVTSPVNTVTTDIDSLIKNDWIGTGESNQTSADAGTTSGTSSAVSTLEKDLADFGEGTSEAVKNPISKAGLAEDVKNALNATAGGIIPGLGNLLGKIHL